MSKDNELFGEYYNTHFDPDVYLSSFYKILDKTVEDGLVAFIIEGVHDIFSSGVLVESVCQKRLAESLAAVKTIQQLLRNVRDLNLMHSSRLHLLVHFFLRLLSFGNLKKCTPSRPLVLLESFTQFGAEQYTTLLTDAMAQPTSFSAKRHGMLRTSTEINEDSNAHTGNVGGKRLLDIGTGPIPHPVVPAIPFVQEIYLTDFSKVNRKYLQDAIFGSGEQTYCEVLQHIASLKDNQKTWTDLSVDLKSKVSGIFSIDLLKENIFVDSYFPLFDVITSSLCIEAAAPNVEAYEDIAKKISTFLKPGGHLILVGVLDQNFYMVGKHKFYSLHISKKELERCWQSAGFSISKWDEMKGPNADDNEYSDFGSCFVMHCIKNS